MCSTARGPRFESTAASPIFCIGCTVLEPLQDEVLERLEPRVRKIYEYGGFREPHIGYVDPTLSSPQVANPPASLDPGQLTGNCLNRLYVDTLNVRLALARPRPAAQRRRTGLPLYLLSLLADTALLILPGKLSVPLMIWQAQTSAQSAAQAVADDRWGRPCLILPRRC